MVQAAFSECLFLDLLSHLQDFRAATVINIGGCQVADALVLSVVVVMVDEGIDLPFQVTVQEWVSSAASEPVISTRR